MIYVLVGLGYLIDLLFIIHDNRKHDGLSVALKTLASACFVVLAIVMSKRSTNVELAKLIIYALVADLFGDFVLILRNITNKKHDLIFLSGTACFIVGHIFLMIMLYKNNPNVVVKSFIYTAIASLVFVPFFIKKLSASKTFKLIGCLYTFFIIYIQVYGVCSIIDIETNFDLAFLFGYFLFAVSDIILIIQKFKENSSSTLQPIYRLSYFISQVVIALSIAYL